MSSVTTANLLIEILTEELPPINLEQNIGESFSSNIVLALKTFMTSNSSVNNFVSPRRFGLIINDVVSIEADISQLRKGPSIQNGLKEGSPTQALLGFTKSCNIHWEDLEQKDDGYFYASTQTKGRKLNEIINDAIIGALKKLPITKNMRWGNNDFSFVRPIHNVVIIHGDKVITNGQKILGKIPTGYTFGHRVMGINKINISHTDDYFNDLTNKGYVIASFNTRRDNILMQLTAMAKQLNLQINNMPGLLDEVTALVEYPIVLCGEFNREFLQVPQECLVLSMAKNQKYFALLNTDGKLSNKFLFVTNIESANPDIIIKGNEKVLGARLQDAKFFFEVDKKNTLANFVKKLSNVVYHNQLGSLHDRILRLQHIAENLAPLLNIDPSLAKDTAYLLKADLATEMVGEFPELQGVMGKYYARFHGSSDEIANAIEQHYYPRFSGDELPNSSLATLMSLSDKLETLIGIWGIGLMPTGDKDPFALRRAALGVVRILLRDNLDIIKLLTITHQAFSINCKLSANTVEEVYQFILNRLENYLAAEYSINCIRSILFTKPTCFPQIPGLLDNLTNFANNNASILQANKRIENILTKNNHINYSMEIKPNLFENTAENSLFEVITDVDKNINTHINNQDWTKYFNLLSKFNLPITNFFDNVMVMVENQELQQNRIALLAKLYNLTNNVCKLSELS